MQQNQKPGGWDDPEALRARQRHITESLKNSNTVSKEGAARMAGKRLQEQERKKLEQMSWVQRIIYALGGGK